SLAFLFGALVGCGQPTADDGKTTVPVNNDLAPVATVAGYQIQPPKGLTLSKEPVSPDEFEWAGPGRDDASAAFFRVHVWPGPDARDRRTKEGGMADPLSLEDYFSAALSRLKRGLSNWKGERRERFTSNGVEFIGIRWQGTDPDGQKVFHGV